MKKCKVSSEQQKIEYRAERERDRERKFGAISAKMVISPHEKTLKEIKGHFQENCKGGKGKFEKSKKKPKKEIIFKELLRKL